ncbi:uncharacterized protein B0P05DRAFT_564336 [Gilbertella persicaria]|uniref:uncharacterized protein n=1 Tax=Gilbertella persicaria TaxID=101096 RepID=UPI00221E9BC4|nr:uncharacterized protein B0P05DRAFT_564336 [Gilbertella persicaria]KAI8048591.1 hypothetical protein B0P05DRAFT_564336 [Gilbertella persicaria]
MLPTKRAAFSWPRFFASTHVCKDCNKTGHFSKAYFKCKLYEEGDANDELQVKKGDKATVLKK